MTFYDKVKWGLGILLVFFLILATNLVDRNNFTRVKRSVITIYEDRLIAKDIVYELSLLMQEKRLANVSADANFYADRNQAVDRNVEELIQRFSKTRLTTEEARVFDNLKVKLDDLKKYEQQQQEQQSFNQKTVVAQLQAVKEDLYRLSKIQMDEGRRQLLITKEAIHSVEVFTQIEIYVLIVLAILVQIIVIYRPKADSK